MLGQDGDSSLVSRNDRGRYHGHYRATADARSTA